MIDMEKAKDSFNKFLDGYRDNDSPGFQLKAVHTYHVVEIAKGIATKSGLSDEDIKLAALVALLHDIGRFEEINHTSSFDSAGFDHASYGVKLLFEDHLIRDFIADDSYDEIIKNAIGNHSKIAIQDGLDDRCLLHAKIIRDADKLDNFRVKQEEKLEAIFPGKVNTEEDIERSILSDRVYAAAANRKSVDIRDRVTPLDYWVCVLAFVFDLNFKESYEVIKENGYIDSLIDRFAYSDAETRDRMEEIRNIMNDFVNRRAYRELSDEVLSS
ncbi:MAG: HD domain-containing protein [Oscillibacter sp.]|nr:HD domain-containing protein [Oscillibacter sp.]